MTGPLPDQAEIDRASRAATKTQLSLSLSRCRSELFDLQFLVGPEPRDEIRQFRRYLGLLYPLLEPGDA